MSNTNYINNLTYRAGNPSSSYVGRAVNIDPKNAANPLASLGFSDFTVINPSSSSCDLAGGDDLDIYLLKDPMPATVYRQTVAIDDEKANGKFSANDSFKSIDGALDPNLIGVINSRYQATAISSLIDKYEKQQDFEVKATLFKAIKGLIIGYFKLMFDDKSGINLGGAASRKYVSAEGELVSGMSMNRSSDAAADLLFIKGLIWLRTNMNDSNPLSLREVNYISKIIPEDIRDKFKAANGYALKLDVVLSQLINRIKILEVYDYNSNLDERFCRDGNYARFISISEDHNVKDRNGFLSIDFSVFRSDALLVLAEYDSQDRDYWLGIRKNMFELARQVQVECIGFIPDQCQIKFVDRKLVVEEELDIRNKLYEQGKYAAQFIFELYCVGKSNEESFLSKEEVAKYGIANQAQSLLKEILSSPATIAMLDKSSSADPEAKAILSVLKDKQEGKANRMLTMQGVMGGVEKKTEYPSLLLHLVNERINGRQKINVTALSEPLNISYIKLEPAVIGEGLSQQKMIFVQVMKDAAVDKKVINDEWHAIYYAASKLLDYMLADENYRDKAKGAMIALGHGHKNFDEFLSDGFFSDVDLSFFTDEGNKGTDLLVYQDNKAGFYRPSKDFIYGKGEVGFSYNKYYDELFNKVNSGLSLPSMSNYVNRYVTQLTLSNMLSVDPKKAQSQLKLGDISVAEARNALSVYFQVNIVTRAKIRQDQQLVENCIEFLNMASYFQMENNIHEGANMITMALGYMEEALSIVGRYDDAPVILKRLISNPDIFGKEKLNNPLLRLALIKATRLLGYASYYTDRPQIFSNLMDCKKMLDDYKNIDGNRGPVGVRNAQSIIYGKLTKEDVGKQVYFLWIRELLEFLATVDPPHLALSYCNVALGLDQDTDVNNEYKEIALFNLYQHLKDDSVNVVDFKDQVDALRHGKITEAITKYLNKNRMPEEYKDEIRLLRGSILDRAVQYDRAKLEAMTSDNVTTVWLKSYLDQNQKAITETELAISSRIKELDTGNKYAKKMDNSRFFFRAYSQLMSLYAKRAGILNDISQLNKDDNMHVELVEQKNKCMEDSIKIGLSFLNAMSHFFLPGNRYSPKLQIPPQYLKFSDDQDSVMDKYLFNIKNIDNNSLTYDDMVDFAEKMRVSVAGNLLDFSKMDILGKSHGYSDLAVNLITGVDNNQSFQGYDNALRIFKISVPVLMNTYIQQAKSIAAKNNDGSENSLNKARLLTYIVNNQKPEMMSSSVEGEYSVKFGGNDVFTVALSQLEYDFFIKLSNNKMASRGIVKSKEDFVLQDMENDVLFNVVRAKTTIEAYNQLSAMGIQDVNLEERAAEMYDYLINNFTDDQEVIKLCAGFRSFAPNRYMNNNRSITLIESVIDGYRELKQGKGSFENYFWSLLSYGELKSDQIIGQLSSLNTDVQLVSNDGTTQLVFDELVKYQELLELLAMYTDPRFMKLLLMKSVTKEGIPIVDSLDHKKLLYSFAVKFLNLITSTLKSYEQYISKPTITLKNRQIIEASLQSYQDIADKLSGVMSGTAVNPLETDHWLVRLFVANKEIFTNAEVIGELGPMTEMDKQQAVNRYVNYKQDIMFNGINPIGNGISSVMQLSDRFSLTVAANNGEILYFPADNDVNRYINSIDLADSMLLKARTLASVSKAEQEVLHEMLDRDIKSFEYLVDLSEKKDLPVPLINRFGDVQEIGVFASGSYYVGTEPDLAACYKAIDAMLVIGEKEKAINLLNKVIAYEKGNTVNIYIDSLDLSVLKDILSLLDSTADNVSIRSYLNNKITSINKTVSSFTEFLPEWVEVLFEDNGKFTLGEKADYMGYRAYGLLASNPDLATIHPANLKIDKRNKGELTKIYGFSNDSQVTSFDSQLPYTLTGTPPDKILQDRFLQAPANNLREGLVTALYDQSKLDDQSKGIQDANVPAINNRDGFVLPKVETVQQTETEKRLKLFLSENSYSLMAQCLADIKSIYAKQQGSGLNQLELQKISRRIDNLKEVMEELDRNIRIFSLDLGSQQDDLVQYLYKLKEKFVINLHNINLKIINSSDKTEAITQYVIRDAYLSLLTIDINSGETTMEKLIRAVNGDDSAVAELKGIYDKFNIDDFRNNSFVDKMLMMSVYADYRALSSAKCADEVSLRQMFMQYSRAIIMSNRMYQTRITSDVNNNSKNELCSGLTKLYVGLQNDMGNLINDSFPIKLKFMEDIKTRIIEVKTNSLLAEKKADPVVDLKIQQKYYTESAESKEMRKILDNAVAGTYYPEAFIRSLLFFIEGANVHGSSGARGQLDDYFQQFKDAKLNKVDFYEITVPLYKKVDSLYVIDKELKVKIPGYILIDFMKSSGQGYR
ncbi:MAG: hypothetical protein PHF25_05360 [Candidatus Margulisbacteria bacterium]|nr:hypothetical protein [Candidatus Margulisiibacteriota bacterium]